MNEIGITQGHSAAAALMCNGEIVGMMQEERFTKRKNQVAFPINAIRELVDLHLGGNSSRVDRFVFASKNLGLWGSVLDRYSAFGVHDHVREQHELWYPAFYKDRSVEPDYWLSQYKLGRHLNYDHGYDLSFLDEMDWREGESYFAETERFAPLDRELGWHGEYTTIDHHKCHAYYAYYGAQLSEQARQEALVLTADAWGDGRNWSAWLPKADGTLEGIAGGPEHSVARIYKFVTLILGMKPNEHEYKIMGLAPYSKSKAHIEATERVFFEALNFRNGKFVSERPLKDSYFDLKERLEGYRFDNISAAVQNWATKITGDWAEYWLKETGRKGICFSGGLSMNIRMNGELLDRGSIHWISVPASGGDESLCAGACFANKFETGGGARAMTHCYLGSLAKGDDWSARLHETQLSAGDFGILSDVEDRELAKLLAGDVIIARCLGPAEFGARALGNRSILANPSNVDNIKIINDAIKNRDFWMPFTPSILAEYANDLLENPKEIVSAFMTIGFRSKPEWRSKFHAGLHPGDHSARPQFVLKSKNEGYWSLINAFREITGIPVLLNTSLNLHGEPMNYTLADAVRTVALSDLDFLAGPDQTLYYKRSAADKLTSILGRTE